MHYPFDSDDSNCWTKTISEFAFLKYLSEKLQGQLIYKAAKNTGISEESLIDKLRTR